jgi:cysteine synthase B
MIELTTVKQVDENLLRKVLKLEPFIGNTPLYPINGVYRKKNVRIHAKLEWQQLGGSVKSRPAFEMIKQAILTGKLTSDSELLDATSGNTGIAYATICAAIGVKVTLCMPSNASETRKKLLSALGANIVYTSAFDNTDGAQLEAKKLKAAYPERYYYADQYANDNNWRAHYNGTGVELLKQTERSITHFVSALGTTGTFTGTGRRLKDANSGIHLTSLQPDSILHGMEGWKHLETAIVPKFYDADLADSKLEVSTEEAFELIRSVAQKEGLMISPSAAANLAGAIQVAEKIKEGTVVTIFPDNAEKYQEVIDELF